jgi:predicted dehydrogenase
MDLLMVKDKTRLIIIGTGGFGRHHLKQILQQQDTTKIIACCEPDPQSFDKAIEFFVNAGAPVPQNIPILEQLLEIYAGVADAALIATPHVYHFSQAAACLNAGFDVLLEKPMVMDQVEARRLIEICGQTGKLLVVAFPGSLSPQIRTAVQMLRSGQIGNILSVSGTVWQSWGPGTSGKWRQNPAISGGGFMFDTGAHLLNTVSDLVGEEFVEVAAWLDNHGRPVDTRAVIIARLHSGALVTLNGCGEAIPSCASDIKVFTTKAVLYTGIWGERLQIQYKGDLPVSDIPVPPSMGVWEQFLAVRNGELENPCPPEVGLRMAKLWDAIKLSSSQNGNPIKFNRV